MDARNTLLWINHAEGRFAQRLSEEVNWQVLQRNVISAIMSHSTSLVAHVNNFSLNEVDRLARIPYLLLILCLG